MRTSAGILLFATRDGGVHVLVVHPSGAYNARAPWSLPKGEPEPGEAPEAAARRETFEEVGVDVIAPLVSLGHVDYTKSKKRIFGFAAPLPDGASPTCASWEIDRAELVPAARARELLHPDQRVFVDRLLAHLALR